MACCSPPPSTPAGSQAPSRIFSTGPSGTIGRDLYKKPVAWLNVAAHGAPNAHESLRKVLGYVNASIVEPACLSVPVTSAMVNESGLVTDQSVAQRLMDSLGMLTDARPS